MAKGSKKWWYLPCFAVLIIYIFIVPRRIPVETVIKPLWVNSLESNYPVILPDFSAEENERLLPFTLGDRFGYIQNDGNFTINQTRFGYVSQSENSWAEYEALPSSIQVMNPENEILLTIENPKGYPLFLNNQIYIIGFDQSYITALSPDGEELWTYDFPAPITCVDGTESFLLAGTLDGTLILLNSRGAPVFTPFEPGGSRLSVILGCAISKDASHLAIISGIGEQRFLLLERSGDTYKVIYHEFLTSGFRRPTHIRFADNDTKVIFEREEGIGIYSIGSRNSIKIPLRGEIVAIDNSGEDGFLFAITSQGLSDKRFIAIRYPYLIVNEAPFKSNNAFFSRHGKQLYLGGDLLMASFKLEKN